MDFGRRIAEIDAALASGEIEEAVWYELVREVVDAAYLSSDNPREQSGLGGDAAHWERRRRVLVEAIDRDGTVLDVGCANGLLMETLVGWAEVRGHRLVPYGLDISAGLAELARSRLPHRANHIFVGNVMGWEPPLRFDYVFSGLEYVPAARRPDLVAHLRERIVAPGGRLAITSYRARGEVETEPVAERLRSWGLPISGEAVAIDDVTGAVATRVVWSDSLRR